MKKLISPGSVMSRIAGAALLLCACGGDSPGSMTTDLAQTPPDASVLPDLTPAPDLTVPPAMVRVVNTLPGSPAVDLYIHPSEKPFATNVVYGDVSVYVAVPPGLLNIDARPAGADPVGFPWFATPPLAVSSGESVTLALAGTVSASGFVNLRPDPSLSEGFAAPMAGTTRIRVVNASADAPALSFDFGNTGAPQASAIANWGDSGAPGVAVPSDKLITTVTVSGGQPATFLTQFTLPQLTERTNMFLFVLGSVARLPRESAGLSFLLVGAGGGRMILPDPAVYVLHAVPDGAALDAYSATTEVSANQAFGSLSTRIQLPPNSYTFDFFAHGPDNMRPAGNPLYSSAKVALVAGQRYLFAASGYQVAGNGRPAASVAMFQEGFTIDAAKPYLTLFGASADAGSLDAGPVVNGALASTIATGVAWKGTSPIAGVTVPAAAYKLGLAKSGTNVAAGTFAITFANGNRLLGIPAGSLAPQNGEPSFRLFTIDTAAWPWTLATVMP